MTRSILVVIAVGAFVGTLSSTGCGGGGVGDPCIPEQEYDTCFAGFDEAEINVESKSFQCLTRLCLVNHFQGRVSCPYGQTAGTQALDVPHTDQWMSCPSPSVMPMGKDLAVCPTGAKGGCPQPTYPGTGTGTCTIPGGASVLGETGTLASQYQIQVAVPPQVTPRQTQNTVYCSCRCANSNGQTNDGSVYCSCPDGYCCQQLVTSIGTVDTGLTGGYCIKGPKDQNNAAVCAQTGADVTVYNPANNSSQQNCNPMNNKCP